MRLIEGEQKISKLVTLIVSLFSAAYVALWPTYFPNSPLTLDELPIFDGRVVQYSTEKEVRDYFRWRQVDTHINSLYNTTFWALVLKSKPPLSEAQAHQVLSGSNSDGKKNEILFQQFGINYNQEDAMYRKGSLLVWDDVDSERSGSSHGAEADELPSTDSGEPNAHSPATNDRAGALNTTTSEAPNHNASDPSRGQWKTKKRRPKKAVVVVHEDLIADSWWETGRGKGLLE